MDFLDPKKQRQHTVLLYSGYILIAIAILISTVVLVYQANGYGVNGKGQVVQNGLVFFSSQPNPAKIYLNNRLNSNQTNTRLSLAAGQYNVTLSRPGYRDWQHGVTVQGGDVQQYTYPFLFPKTLATKSITSTAATGITSQSPDKRWLITQVGDSTTFNLYDLKDPAQVTATSLTLPAAIVSTNISQSWKVIGWADDNVHLLLAHTFGTNVEYIEIDRTDVTKAVNLTQIFNASPSTVTLNNNKYDQFYFLDSKTATLSTANLGSKQVTKLLTGVISYKSYGDSTVLYATANDAPTNEVNIEMFSSSQNYLLRQVKTSSQYLLDMASYNGTPYVVIGAEDEVYIYQDPLSQLNGDTNMLPTAVRAFSLPAVSYVGFSPNAQFIVGESGSRFAVDDLYVHRAYQYSVSQQLDAPQLHATWMDGDRLVYVSANKLWVMDYDNTNTQLLTAANPNYTPYFSADYHYVYNLLSTATTTQLQQTPLLTSADL